ncbi:universal stress protein [Streptomyces sp. NPDC057740]|uniref:universal stress protein n=1 Tax=Streptomyces sp. NPDC057740 TaxID=3346234 RepID=UPI0036C28EF5
MHIWQLPYVPYALEAKALRDVRTAAVRVLDAVFEPWREKFPTVEITELVEEGRSAQPLLNAAKDAGLLAVRRRIRPARIGMHTGPVAHAVVHHVRCPVSIVT